MSDMDEGDSDLVGRFCKCGLAAPPDNTWDELGLRACPKCDAIWPEKLRSRAPHDGGPEILSWGEFVMDRAIEQADKDVPATAWTVEQAAEYLGITSPETIKNWLCGGSFPGAKQGNGSDLRTLGHWRFLISDVKRVKAQMDETRRKNQTGQLAVPDLGAQNCRTRVSTDLMNRIAPIINGWDPEGLIRMGAPEDEYVHEIEQIVGSRYRIHSINDGITVVCEVFNNAFGELFGLKPGVPPGPQEGYRPDGYDGERIQQAGQAVFGAVLEHRAWLYEDRRPRREEAKKNSKGRIEAMLKARGWTSEEPKEKK